VSLSRRTKQNLSFAISPSERSTILSTTPIGAKSRRRKQLKNRQAMDHSGAKEEEVKTTGTAVTLKWLMATALVARSRFGSSKVTALCELGLPSRRKAARKIAAPSV
jgi:hypothetical protein